MSLSDYEADQNTAARERTVATELCNISFSITRTVRDRLPTGFVGTDERLMIIRDKARRHPRLTTTIVPKYGAVRVTGSKHFKRNICNSSQLIHT